MGIYTKIIQDSITGIYRTNAANKILQFIKRIRNESDMDQARRFLIELMQNARDLAYKTPEGDTEPVSVRIRLSDTELEFSHNGKVFSVKDILSIIYQVSSKKPGEGIGQFGTGFMSTYQLSEKVELTSYLKNGENPYLPFTVCLDRSGCSKEEILEAIEASMDQLVMADESAEGVLEENFDRSGYNTSFLYHLDQEKSREIAKTGMEDLDHTILYILLFSPQISTVELIYDTCFRKERIVYTNGKPESRGNGLYTMEFRQGETVRHLVYQYVKDGAERITVASEYSNGQILPVKTQMPRLYIDFPLVGSEQFPFPVVLNCRMLCPNEPRSSISLVDNQNSQDALCNKKIMKQAVALYGQFLHNLVEQGFGGLQNVIAVPVYQENKEWSAQWVRARLYNGCFKQIKKEPIFQTRLGMACFESKELCLIRERDEQQRNVVQELADPFLDLLVPLDDTDWDLAFAGYEIEQEKWISLELLLQNAEYNVKHRLDTGHQDVLSWVGRLYCAAMGQPKLANEIMAGVHRIFIDQEYGRSDRFTLKRFGEIRKDPGILECLKDASEFVDMRLPAKERLLIRSSLLHPKFPILEERQPEDYETALLTGYLSSHGEIPNTLSLAAKTFHEYRSSYWKIMAACGPDENMKKIAEVFWETDLSRLAQTLDDPHYPHSMWEGTYRAVLWSMSDWISRCHTLEGFCRESKQEEAGAIEWLNGFYRAVADHLPLHKVKERQLVLDQTGIFRSAVDLSEDHMDMELREIASVLYGKYGKEDLKTQLADRRLCLLRWELYPKSNRSAANIINMAVQQLLTEQSLSLAREEYQAACSRLMGWIGDHEEEAASLFPAFSKEEDRMKLLTPKAAVQLNRKVKVIQELLKETGVGSVEKLKEIIRSSEEREAEQEFFDDPENDVDSWGDEYLNGLSHRELDEKIRKIGQAGELHFNQELIREWKDQGYHVTCEDTNLCCLEDGHGHKTEIYRPDSEDYHQAGWDIRVRRISDIEMDNGAGQWVDDLYEVKTCTIHSSYRHYLRVSNEQMANAAAWGGHYHIVKVICDPENLQAVECRRYDDLMYHLGKRTLENVGKGYILREKQIVADYYAVKA